MMPTTVWWCSTSGVHGPGRDGGRPGGDGDGLLSFIWISNSGQGTVSKINTETMLEEGRYIVRADATGSPSRTSVNLNGDVEIVQTSEGAVPLPWGEEECIAWHNPLVCTSNRPVAWTTPATTTAGTSSSTGGGATSSSTGDPDPEHVELAAPITSSSYA